MSLTVGGYPQSYAHHHHHHHHQTQSYQQPHHPGLSGGLSGSIPGTSLSINSNGSGGGIPTPGGLSPPNPAAATPAHRDFYPAYPTHLSHPQHHTPHHQLQMTGHYSSPYHHHHEMDPHHHLRPDPSSPSLPPPPSSTSSSFAAAAAAAAVTGSYFPNWMLTPPPELTTVTGHIPDGFHSLGGPGSNSPGGSTYQSFIQYENGVPVRCIKRRVTANKKERRRTLSINNAFSQLRGCIPNVPSDTKLSKIKTLRLATSYISYLMDILARDDPDISKCSFKAELTKQTPGPSAAARLSQSGYTTATPSSSGNVGSCVKMEGQPGSSLTRGIMDRNEETRKRESDGESEASSQGSSPCPEKKPKGRTGWPQHVWASELK